MCQFGLGPSKGFSSMFGPNRRSHISATASVSKKVALRVVFRDPADGDVGQRAVIKQHAIEEITKRLMRLQLANMGFPFFRLGFHIRGDFPSRQTDSRRS